MSPWCWPVERATDALVALSIQCRLAVDPSQRPAGAPADIRDDNRQLDRWLDHVAGRIGVEVESTEVSAASLESFIRHGGPGVLRLPDEGLCALLGAHRGRARVLGPDGLVHHVSVAELADRLRRDIVAPARAACAELLDAAAVPAGRRRRAEAHLLDRRLQSHRVRGLWQLRASPGSDPRAQLGHEKIGRWLAIAGAAHAVQIGLLIGAWWIIGGSVFAGRPDEGWLWAWALVLTTLVPLRLVGAWAQGKVALTLGAWLKRRLLVGALSIDPDVIRSRGGGQLLAQVYESSAVEALALQGGLASASALIDLVAAGWVLSQGASGWLHVSLLAAWTGLVLLATHRHALRRIRWAGERMTMTQDLVERMVGHCTRLVQQAPERWHEDESAAARIYLDRSAAMDRRALLLSVVASRGWLCLGIIGLWPALTTGAAGAADLAIAFGGVLLALHAFVILAGGLRDLTDLWIAWREVAPLSAAASLVGQDRPKFLATAPVTPDDQPGALALVEARGLSFRYPSRERPTLSGCDLAIRGGDRLLLEGSSGGGKSTLASLLVGLRQPDAGLLLLEGLDRSTHGGEGWRARVAAAPQFHDNHVFTGTFAFNLLMGRRWPARAEDYRLARAVCIELGLGPLLERMPAGMEQIVGESGWQLSHGERSRLYLARALLQDAKLVVLDESLAALDPDNQARALDCAWQRAPTLLVIAHP